MVESTHPLPKSSELPHADGLPAVLELAARSPQLLAQIGQLVYVDIVVDVNVIVALLIGKVRIPEQKSRLEELVGSGLVRLHIPHWAITELTNSALPQAAASQGLPERLLHEQWRRYEHLFEVHNQYDAPNAMNYAPGGDLKDEPYATLATDIGAWGVLSKDGHFNDSRVVHLSHEHTGAFRDYARYETASLSFRVGGLHLTQLTLHGVADLIGGLVALWRGLPVAVQLTLIALTGYAAANPTIRSHVLAALEAAEIGRAHV